MYRSADLTALAVKNPVSLGVFAQVGHGGGHAEGHRQADDHGIALLYGGGSQGVVGGAD